LLLGHDSVLRLIRGLAEEDEDLEAGLPERRRSSRLIPAGDVRSSAAAKSGGSSRRVAIGPGVARPGEN
jgi:hypothetical protein